MDLIAFASLYYIVDHNNRNTYTHTPLNTENTAIMMRERTKLTFTNLV